MNRKLTCSESFRKDSQLCQFYLDKTVTPGKTLGVGSYGSVLEIKYEETIYAAKQIHDLLLQAGNEGVCEIIEKYRRECQLMAGLRHPNITQFLGLCVLEGFQLPLLVMERLEMSVNDLLECSPNIPLSVKISILTDTSSGLVYLHSLTPPIVHRDLTARNVLLTASLTAKITDLGNSRMVTFRPGQLAQTLTKTPGTTVYMPPEALSESHRYGPSLDVFSFGHLALFTLNQIFPGELLSSTYPNPSNPDQLIARSEVDRRQTYMATLETTCGASHPVLLDLVRQCLHDTPERRPPSQDLLTRLRAVKSEIEGVYGGSVVKQLNIASVLYVKEMKDKDRKILELEVSQQKLVAENQELRKVIEVFEQKLHENFLHHKEEMEHLKAELNKKECMKTSFQPDWRQGPDMPVAMSSYIQSVVIDDTVYVGGGGTDSDKDDYIVMAYDIRSYQWYNLCPYSTKWFGMSVLNNKLVLVGGRTRYYPSSRELGEWQPITKQWTHPFPPMSTPRRLPSATSYEHWLVVAGGDHDYGVSCEILNDHTKEWSTATCTRTSWKCMKSAIVGDTWYLMGGGDGVYCTPNVYAVSLEALVSHCASASSNLWKKLPALNFTDSCPVNFEGSLLAVGGYDNNSRRPVSIIQCFVPDTNSWVQIGELPEGRYHCTCFITGDKIHVMGGSDGKTKLKETLVAISQKVTAP